MRSFSLKLFPAVCVLLTASTVNAIPVHQWSHNFGAFANSEKSKAVAVDGNGNAVMTGDYQGTIDFGGGPLVSAGAYDVFVGKFDSDGLHLWSKRFGDASTQTSSAITTDGLGSVVIAGKFFGTIDFGGGPLLCSCVDTLGVAKLFVAKLDANGNHLWSKRFGGDEAHYINSVATDPSGNVLLTGSFRGTLDFGGGPLVGNDFDIFVAKLDVDGNHLWSKRFGGNTDQWASSIVVDAAGNVVVTGAFIGNVDFGGGPIASTDDFDVFVAKFDSGGNHLWSRGFGGNADQFASSVAARMGGGVVITGNFGGDVNFGGGNLNSAGDIDVFLAQFDANGNHLWSQSFGDNDSQWPTAVDTDGSGNVVITGNFAGTIDFGGGPITCACNDTVLTENIFVSQFDGNGNHLWSRGFGGCYSNSSNSVAADAAGSVVITGEFVNAIDFGGGPLTGSHDVFLAKFIRSPAATVTVPHLRTSLAQNFPNPFQPTTTIAYTLGERSSVVVGIYDVAGRLVAELKQGVREPGTHQVEWDGKDAAGRVAGSGVYFYRLEGAPRVAPKKMVRLK